MSEENINNEDYLKEHLAGLENRPKQQEESSQEERQKETLVKDLNYFHHDVKQFPCGKFYPEGTTFMIRPATVKEIQAYSMVDDSNTFDIVEKMNNMIQSCVMVKYPDGRKSSYLDIKDQDRLALIFTIRDLTFQQKKSLNITTKCPTNDQDVEVEISLANFVYHEENERYKKFFDNELRGYRFPLKNGKTFEITLPTLGIQKSFTDYILKENAKTNSNLNFSFIKIMPFLVGNRTKITDEEINNKLKEFEKIDMDSFQFLNDLMDNLKFGPKELKKYCEECGEEVRVDFTFPDPRASAIFVIHGSADDFIQD